MKQQTAVEWFREKVFFKGSYTGEELRQLFNEALAMEKQQSIELLTKYHDGLFYVPFKDGEAEAIYNHLTNRNESKTNI
jgi:hypothetical protein